MKTKFTFLLVVCLFCASAFTNKAPISPSPSQISQTIFKALMTSDATTFATIYDIEVPDMEWYNKKIEADSLIDEETKEDFISEFTSHMQKANKALSSDFNTKWLGYLKAKGIVKEEIKFIDSYYILTNKTIGIPSLGLEIKFIYKNTYHFIDISLLDVNGQWKGVYINNVDACDKYFDGY
jgi:hypothetical protein